MRIETEKRFKAYLKLRKDGYGVCEAGEIIGVSRVTASKFEQWIKNKSLPNIITKLEQRLAEMVKSDFAKPDELVKLADAISKLEAIQRKRT